MSPCFASVSKSVSCSYTLRAKQKVVTFAMHEDLPFLKTILAKKVKLEDSLSFSWENKIGIYVKNWIFHRNM
jgi:hypothetical protein